jgi:C4-dicarboxylate-specific signal transduction histidine kinase
MGQFTGAQLKLGQLSRKIYLAFLLVAAVPTAVAGAIGIYYSLQGLQRETLSNLEQEVGIRAQGIERFFQQLGAELAYFSGTHSLEQFRKAQLSAFPETLSQARRMLEQDFVRLATSYPHIYQVRLLNAAGQEMVRVDRRSETVSAVPQERLQDKSDRYYFTEAMKLAPGALYISPLDLNEEFGQVELPERPVIRVGIALGEGDQRELLIFNLYAELFLSQIQEMADARAGDALLLDQSGHFLARSHGGQETGFSRLPLSTLETRYGDKAVASLLGKANGTCTSQDYILSHAQVRLGAANGGWELNPLTWTLALAFPKQRLLQAVFHLSLLYAVLFAGLTAIAAGGYVLSRQLLGPMEALSRETEILAAGDFSHRLEIRGNDEIADLGRRFNIMAERLQQLYADLQGQKEHLAQEVKARTRDLEHERTFLAAVVQQSGDAILAVDAQGEITLANDAASSLLGYPPIPGHPLVASWPDFPVSTASQNNTTQRIDLHTDEQVLALTLTPLQKSGGLVVVARDVSEERRLQDERRELDRQLFQMEKMTTLGELAMGIAHEIGNPLAGMKAVAQAMQYEEDIPQGLLEGLRRMEREIDRLSGFLRSFHGFAAPHRPQRRACDLKEILDDVLFWVRKEIKQRGIELSLSVDGVPPLLADPNGLKQLLLNLVINALYVMPNGGRLTIQASLQDDKHLLMKIRDTGPGIPEAVLARLFEPFFTTRAEGTGLGLTIARKIAADHAAALTVANLKSGGAQFSLVWPLA